MGLKAVFFDLDDTLYSSFKECNAHGYKCMGAWAEAHLGVPGEEFEREFLRSRRRLARQQGTLPTIHDRVLIAQGTLEHFGFNPMRHARALSRVYWDAALSKMEIRSGVTELFDFLRQAGVKTAICTDMMADIQMEKLELLGLADKVDYMVSSEEAGMDKPGPAIFRLALHKCRCLAGEAVMVGDNFQHDVQGAFDAGIQGIWLNWTQLPTPEDACSHIEVHSFEQAAAQIRALVEMRETRKDAAL